jgi:hypothetical protein
MPARVISEPAYCVIFGFRLDGRQRFVVARVSLEDESSGIVQDQQGRFPVFASEAEARRWAINAFPLPAQEPGDDVPMADLVRGMEDLYAKAGAVSYDLDAVKRWTADPAARAAGPGQVLEAWVFLYWAGVAPAVDLSDLAGHPDARGLAGMARMLGMMSRDRSTGAPGGWPDDSSFWGKDENGYLAGMLRPAIEAFASRMAPAAIKDLRT